MLGWNKDRESRGDQRPAKPASSPPVADVRAVSAPSRPTETAPLPNSAKVRHPASRLGEILLEEGVITQKQLTDALAKQEKDKGFLGQALVELGIINQQTLVSFLVKQCRIPHICLLDYGFNNDLISLVPRELCLKYKLIPIDKLGKILTVAMVDPLDLEALSQVRAVCPELRIKPILCNWDHFEQVARRYLIDEQAKLEELSAKSFGLSERPQAKSGSEKSAPAALTPGASNALDEAVMAIVAEAGKADTARVVSDPPATLSAFASGSASRPAAPAPGVSLEQIAVATREGLNETLQQALLPLVEQVRASQGIEPGVLSAMADQIGHGLRESLRDAVRESVSAMIEATSRSGPSPEMTPEMLAVTIHNSVGGAMQEAISQLIQAASLGNERSAFDPETVSDLIRASVSNGMRDSMERLAGAVEKYAEAATATAKAAPDMDSLAALIQTSVGGAMQETVALLVQTMGKQPGGQVPALAPEAVADLVRQSIAGSMQEAMGRLTGVVEQYVEAAGESRKSAAPEALAEAVHDSIRAAMGEVIAQLAAQSGEGSRDRIVEDIHRLLATQAAESSKVTEVAQRTLEMVQEAIDTAKASRAATEMATESARQRFQQLVESELPSSVAPFPVADARKLPEDGAAAVPLDMAEAIDGPTERSRRDERIRAALEHDLPAPGFSFADFVPGKANQFVYGVCRGVSIRPGREFNPLFLHGDTGLGKTHLLHAIAAQIQERDRDARITYFSASRFARRVERAAADGALDELRHSLCMTDLLMVDDLQFLEGRPEAQEEFFHVFNALVCEDRQVIAAGYGPPDRLPQLPAWLTSRLAGGVVAGIEPPEWEARMIILGQTAGACQTAVSHDVLELVARRAPNDVRRMIGSLRKVIAFAKLVNQEITPDLAGEVLRRLGIEEAA